jgi:DNA-directed RNA polymerase subunit alpha
MYLRKQGPGAVTAADIAPPAGVEVINTDLLIATLNGKGKLEIELTVERGRGYVSPPRTRRATPRSAASRSTRSTPRSLKVTYKVEATRVEQRTDFDRLVVDVETKSSIARATPWPRPVAPSPSCSVWRAS